MRKSISLLAFVAILGFVPINQAFATCGFNGSGTFVRCYNWVNDKNNGIDITASRFDTEDNNFATGLSNTITKDGQQTTTARIPFADGISFTGSSGVAPIGDLTTGMFSSGSGVITFQSEGTVEATVNSHGLDDTVIGAGTPLAGTFTSLTANSLAITSTASAPTTGMYAPSAGALAFSTTGEAAITISNSGGVSIAKGLAFTSTVSAPTTGIYSPSAGALALSTTGGSALTIGNDQGITIGSPTGGDEGAGTINAENLYVNGAAVPTSSQQINHALVTTGTGWQSPSGITSSTKFEFILVGGGGGVNGVDCGGAGGGQTVYWSNVTGLAATTTYTVAIGAGGTSSGGNGGDTSITIGSDTVTAKGGSGVSSSATGGAGGAGSNSPSVGLILSVPGTNGGKSNGSGCSGSSYPNYPTGGDSMFGGGGTYDHGPTGYGGGAESNNSVATGTQGMIYIQWLQ